MGLNYMQELVNGEVSSLEGVLIELHKNVIKVSLLRGVVISGVSHNKRKGSTVAV